MTPLPNPPTDPTPIFEFFRANLGTELLTAAVSEFGLFERLKGRPERLQDIAAALGLAERPTQVLVTAMRAMGLLDRDAQGNIYLSASARNHLVPGADFDVTGYVGLTASAAGVRAIVDRLKTNRPAGVKPDEGAAFIFKEGISSAMDQSDTARRLTLALAGRAKNVAPHLAANTPLDGVKTMLDVAGGTGIYLIACLRRFPEMRGILLDRPEVLAIAREFADEYGVKERMRFVAGDMFAGDFPGADAVLISNVLHDWDYDECHALLRKAHAALPVGGRVLIHDAFLDDDLGGPLPVAVYSAALFSLTEGRAYSALEYREMLRKTGFRDEEQTYPTLVHCSVLVGRKDA